MVDEKEVIKKLGYEIQCWLESEPETLSRLKKFYNSIISIWLGGEGIMGIHHKEVLKGMTHKELKVIWRNYKVNYPRKSD